MYIFHSAEIRQAVRERRVVGSYVAWEKKRKKWHTKKEGKIDFFTKQEVSFLLCGEIFT
jgi:hypothetical protein